ncbi:MAG: 2-amino-4-hydroxy-6-hydroxymethyldihydropteridine diphosphokinase [Hyphomicrobiaceae bacterium]
MTKLPVRFVLIAFGANVGGNWGKPAETIEHAVGCLETSGLSTVCLSSLYSTPPLGSVRQPRFVNMVGCFTFSIAPGELLRLAKSLEWEAGRRRGVHWGPRPLDIDIISMTYQKIGWQERECLKKRQPGRLLLPHPEMADRGFVMVPLIEIAPHWRHPVWGWCSTDVLRRRPGLARGMYRIGRIVPENSSRDGCCAGAAILSACDG